MATRYWVGGSGNWSDSTNHWATTSGGTPAVGNLPTFVDDVVFDNLSNTGTTIFTVTVTNSSVCQNISFGSGATALDAVMTLAGTGTWSIYGSMTLVSTNLSVTYTGTITWAATTTGKTITTAGKSFSIFTFNGLGGGWTLQDALTLSNGLTLLAGAVDTNNQAVTANGGSENFATSGSATRSLTLGTSTYTCAGLVITWNVTSTTGFTLSAASSTISLTSGDPEFNGGGLTYGTITYAAIGSGQYGLDILGANTIGTLTITAATTNAVMKVTFDSNQTIGTLNVTSTNLTARRFFQSTTAGTARTLTITTRNVSNTDFRDITIAGAALTGTSLGDCGGNSNITFDTAKTVYWNLAGAQNWGATGWATSSGGSPALANFPLAQDTVVFDNTGSVTGTITINTDFNIGTINITKTGAMTLSISSFVNPNIYGNFTVGALTTISGSSNSYYYFVGRGTQTITSNTRTFANSGIVVQALGGTVIFADAFTTTGSLALFLGTLNLNNFTATAAAFSSNTTSTKAIAFGTTGEITINGSGVAGIFIGTNFTYTGTSKINVSNNSATATSINIATGFTSTNALNVNYTTGTYALTESSGNTYKNLSYSGYSGTVNNVTRTLYGNLTLGSGTTYTAGVNAITFSGTAGTTQTITSNTKTLSNPVTFAGTASTIYQLADAMTLDSASTTTLTNGTLSLNNKTLTTGLFSSSNTNTRSLTLGSASLVCIGSGVTTFNISTTTGMTLSAGTSTISLTSASAKTFAGGGLTYYNINQGGAGALTISGANTFNNITNAVQPTTVTFTSSVTQTFSNFGLNGTAGNLVTINSSTAGTRATLSKASGIVDCNYLSIRDSNAAGGAGWYAGTTSTNVSNNLGWIFTVPPYINVTGVSATGSVGSVTVSTGINIDVNVTGVSATGDVGSVTTNTDQNVSVTGVSATGQVGSVVRTVDVTGVSATGQVGSVTTTSSTNVSVTGVSATGQVGSVTISIGRDVSVTGVKGTGQVGSVTITIGRNVSVTGVSATGSVGSVTVTGTASTSVTGVSATGQVGSVSISISRNVSVTGVSATGSVGSVTLVTGANVSVTGVSATGNVGSVSFVTTANVSVTGVSATGQVGTLFFFQWDTINDSQNANWVAINDSQSANWTTINPNSPNTWADIVI